MPGLNDDLDIVHSILDPHRWVQGYNELDSCFSVKFYAKREKWLVDMKESRKVVHEEMYSRREVCCLKRKAGGYPWCNFTSREFPPPLFRKISHSRSPSTHPRRFSSLWKFTPEVSSVCFPLMKCWNHEISPLEDNTPLRCLLFIVWIMTLGV